MTITVVGVLTGDLRKYPDGTNMTLPSYGSYYIVNGGASPITVSMLNQSFSMPAGGAATYSGHSIASVSPSAVHSTQKNGRWGVN